MSFDLLVGTFIVDSPDPGIIERYAVGPGLQQNREMSLINSTGNMIALSQSDKVIGQ